MALTDRELAHRAGLASVDALSRLRDAVGAGSTTPRPTIMRDAREYGNVISKPSLLQTAINECRATGLVLQLPALDITIEDTLKLGDGDTAKGNHACMLSGQTQSWDGVHGTILRNPFTDRPTINVQCSSNTVIENITCIGSNLLTPANAAEPYASRVLRDYFVAGLSTKRFNPCAGITINAYSGTLPSDPTHRYPNDPYGRNAGGQVTIRGTTVIGFEVGFCCNPSENTPGGGDTIRWVGGRIDNCAYGVSLCDSNGRNISLEHILLGNCHTGLTNRVHGLRGGFPPAVFGGEWNSCYRWFDLAPVAAFMAEGISGEAVHSMGIFTGGSGGEQVPYVIKGCHVYLGIAQAENEEAIFAACGGPVKFISCGFSALKGVINTLGESQPEFDNCTFGMGNGEAWVRGDWAIGLGSPSYGPEVVQERCYYNSGGAPVTHDQRGLYSSPLSQPGVNTNGGRACLTRGSALVHTPSTTYKVVHPEDNPWVDGGAWSGLSWNGTTKRFSFTCPAGEILVGDLLFWNVLAGTSGNNTGVQLRLVPLLEVTSSSAGAVTCKAIYAYNDLDTTYDPGRALISPMLWAPTTPFTGTWTKDSTVVTTNTDPSARLRVGDFVRAAAGLTAVSRVISMTRTTFTLSKLPNSTRTDEPLYFGKLVAI